MAELATTFYGAMSKNRWRTVFLFALFPVMILLVVYLAILILTVSSGNGYGGDVTTQTVDMFFAVSPWVIGLSVLWMVIMVLSGKNMILSLSGAKPIEKKDAPELYRIVENLAIRTGIKTPSVYIINDPGMNAFATGYSPDNAAVTVTRGILERLSPSELESVLAHEFGHILNRDTRVMLIAITLVGILQLMADLVLRSLWFGGLRGRGRNREGGGESGLIILAAIIVIWLIGFVGSVLVQLGISRKREFLADAESAYLTRNPEGLITALQKITSDPHVDELRGKRSIAALCIADPLEEDKQSFLDSLQGLFSTHPSTKKRIEELRRMMGTASRMG